MRDHADVQQHTLDLAHNRLREQQAIEADYDAVAADVEREQEKTERAIVQRTQVCVFASVVGCTPQYGKRHARG